MGHVASSSGGINHRQGISRSLGCSQSKSKHTNGERSKICLVFTARAPLGELVNLLPLSQFLAFCPAHKKLISCVSRRRHAAVAARPLTSNGNFQRTLGCCGAKNVFFFRGYYDFVGTRHGAPSSHTVLRYCSLGLRLRKGSCERVDTEHRTGNPRTQTDTVFWLVVCPTQNPTRSGSERGGCVASATGNNAACRTIKTKQARHGGGGFCGDYNMYTRGRGGCGALQHASLHEHIFSMPSSELYRALLLQN